MNGVYLCKRQMIMLAKSVFLNLLLLMVKGVSKNFESRLFINWGIKSLIILARVVLEFWIVDKFSLCITPKAGEGVSNWYKGVFLVIAVIVIEGIIVGALEGGTFDDLIDYLVEGLPGNGYLFCLILGMQEAVNTYPNVWQSMDFALFIKLVLLATGLGIIQGIKFVFEFCFCG